MLEELPALAELLDEDDEDEVVDELLEDVADEEVVADVDEVLVLWALDVAEAELEVAEVDCCWEAGPGPTETGAAANTILAQSHRPDRGCHEHSMRSWVT